MKTYAKAKDFELAKNVRDTIFALQHIRDVSLIKENLTPTLSLEKEREKREIKEKNQEKSENQKGGERQFTFTTDI